ncbi:hypothetical protein C8R46DRAFT_1071208 [Mycena filopes]|nr:hypothetical protein C8R46DRAFT_1071208 [Mycena filopes]
MAQNLPVELVDLFLGCLNPDDDVERLTIAHCGLVCVEWRRSSRLHLFSEVCLTDSNIQRFLDVVDSSPPYPLLIFVRRLSLGFAAGPGLPLDEHLSRLGPLPNLTALQSSLPYDVLARHSPYLALICPSLTSFTFAAPPFPSISLEHALNAVRYFPALTRLGFHEVNHIYLDLLSTYKFPTHCHTLDLRLHPLRLEDFCRNLLAMEPIPVFSSLHVVGISPKTDSFTGQYMRYLGSGLHYLHLDIREFGLHTEALQLSTGLQHLDLEAFQLSPDRLLSHIMPSLHSPDLHTIVFVDNYEGYIVGYYPDELFRLWGQLDDVLATAPFASLRTFKIVSRSIFVGQIPLFMPRSCSRRVLQVVRRKDGTTWVP